MVRDQPALAGAKPRSSCESTYFALHAPHPHQILLISEINVESVGMHNDEIAKISVERFAEQLGKPEAVLFWQYLDENPSAKEMLTGLYQAGCDPLTLITLAVLYCKGEELGVTETAKHATGYSVQQLASFSERLLG